MSAASPRACSPAPIASRVATGQALGHPRDRNLEDDRDGRGQGQHEREAAGAERALGRHDRQAVRLPPGEGDRQQRAAGDEQPQPAVARDRLHARHGRLDLLRLVLERHRQPSPRQRRQHHQARSGQQGAGDGEDVGDRRARDDRRARQRTEDRAEVAGRADHAVGLRPVPGRLEVADQRERRRVIGRLEQPGQEDDHDRERGGGDDGQRPVPEGHSQRGGEQHLAAADPIRDQAAGQAAGELAGRLGDEQQARRRSRQARVPVPPDHEERRHRAEPDRADTEGDHQSAKCLAQRRRRGRRRRGGELTGGCPL